MFIKFIIIALVAQTGYHAERVHVKLANGGTSRPIVIYPFHGNENKNDKIQLPMFPIADALFMDNPNAEHKKSDSDDAKTKDGDKLVAKQSEVKNPLDMAQQDEPVDKKPTTSAYEDPIGPVKTESNDENNDYPNTGHTGLTSTKISTQVPTTSSTSTTTKTPLVITSQPHTSLAPPTSLPSSIAPVPSTDGPDPASTCHQSCLEALNTTRLYSEQNLLLSQGSDLTLICELPLDPSSFILEDLIWLYHDEGSPTHQCSLTVQEFLPLCQGFQTIKDTKDRNSTFVQESITVTNMLTNYTGQYMCQVRVTCCPKSHEHIMSEERTSHVKVQVWMADYTVDLAIAGSIALVLAIIILAGSFLISRKRSARYSFIETDIPEIKPPTVLHIPLVDDQDSDSFDSNFDEQD